MRRTVSSGHDVRRQTERREIAQAEGCIVLTIPMSRPNSIGAVKEGRLAAALPPSG
jgi:hypothetical protein